MNLLRCGPALRKLRCRFINVCTHYLSLKVSNRAWKRSCERLDKCESPRQCVAKIILAR